MQIISCFKKEKLKVLLKEAVLASEPNLRPWQDPKHYKPSLPGMMTSFCDTRFSSAVTTTARVAENIPIAAQLLVGPNAARVKFLIANSGVEVRICTFLFCCDPTSYSFVMSNVLVQADLLDGKFRQDLLSLIRLLLPVRRALNRTQAASFLMIAAYPIYVKFEKEFLEALAIVKADNPAFLSEDDTNALVDIVFSDERKRILAGDLAIVASSLNPYVWIDLRASMVAAQAVPVSDLA